jgi:hypothetical protein
MKLPFSIYDFFGYLAAGFLLLCTADYAFDGGWLLKKEVWPAYAIFWMVLAYIIGHIVAAVSSYWLEHKFLRGVLVSPEVTLFDQEKRVGFWPKLFPIFFDPFPEETRTRVLKKARADGFEGPGRGLFLHCYAIVITRSHTLERLNTFLNVYGFCRNTSMAALLAIPILVAGMIAKGFDTTKLSWIFVAFGIAVGMFYRYLKFFKHFTEEVFQAYAVMTEAGSEQQAAG